MGHRPAWRNGYQSALTNTQGDRKGAQLWLPSGSRRTKEVAIKKVRSLFYELRHGFFYNDDRQVGLICLIV